MNPVDPLQQLRDIHLPDPVSWWPMAPLWWVLLLLLLLGLVSLAWWGFRVWRGRSYRRVARRELEAHYHRWQRQGDARAYLESVNAILKRAALRAFPAREVASLSGETWGLFLDSHLARPAPEALAHSPLGAAYYSPEPPDSKAIAALQVSALYWLRKHRRRPC